MKEVKNDNMFYFPLYVLRYSTDYKKTINYIISYCIVEYGYRLYSNFILQSGDNAGIEREVEKNPIKNFDYENDLHYYLVFASLRYRIKIPDINLLLEQHKAIENFMSYYEHQHGKDARVKIHRNLIIEAGDGRFEYSLFQVYCAIKSILGKKTHCRITYKRLCFRMQGFKSEKIFYLENCTDKLYTIRQVESRVKKLLNKNLIDTVTYRKRIKFYSKRYKGKALETLVTNSIALNKAKVLQRQERDKRINNNVALRVEEMKVQIEAGAEYPDLKEKVFGELSLVKEC